MTKKYIVYREIFIYISKYDECSYFASAYGFEDFITKNFNTKEEALESIKIFIDEYIYKCENNKIIYRKPTPPDCSFVESSRSRFDTYRVTKEECIRLSDSFYVKEPNFALAALLNKVCLYREDGTSFVDFSKFLRESKFVDANTHVVFVPLTNKIYDIYYKLNYLFGIFQIYVDSNGLLIVEYDRRKIEYGRIYELVYEAYDEIKGRGYLVIHKDGLFDNCEFKGFHNLMADYHYRSNSVLLEDYQVLSKLFPDTDRKITEKSYKLVKFQLSSLFRQAIETDLDEKLVTKFLKLADNIFFFFLNHFVFKYKELCGYSHEFLSYEKYKVYVKNNSPIENAITCANDYRYEILNDIVLKGCQDSDEFEVLQFYLARFESISVNEKDQFDATNLLAAKVAWEYIGKMSDRNQILSVIAIKKIDGITDKELYDEVKDMKNFIKIRELLDIKSNKDTLRHGDKFIKRIIVEHVFKLAEEYQVPKPKLRTRRSTV